VSANSQPLSRQQILEFAGELLDPQPPATRAPLRTADAAPSTA
jgi:hypothetical protein